jgi:hypothetical protein
MRTRSIRVRSATLVAEVRLIKLTQPFCCPFPEDRLPCSLSAAVQFVTVEVL